MARAPKAAEGEAGSQVDPTAVVPPATVEPVGTEPQAGPTDQVEATLAEPAGGEPQTDLADPVETTPAEDRRGFAVTEHLLHDGHDLHPGDTAWLTEAQLDVLRRAGAVEPSAGWLDGER